MRIKYDIRTIMGSNAQLSSLREFTTLNKLKLEHKSMINRLHSFGRTIPKPMVANILTYVKQLPKSGSEYIDKSIFIAQLFKTFGLSDQSLIERIHQVMSQKVRGIEDRLAVTIEDFARLICIYVTDVINIKVDFVFRVYNVAGKNDGVLTSRDIYYKLKPMVQYTSLLAENPDAEEENAKEIVDLTMNMIDINKDSAIEYSEFLNTVMRNPLMLECFGPSFPPRSNLEDFKEVIKRSELEVSAKYRNERRRSLGYPVSTQRIDDLIQRYYPVRLELP